MVDYAGPNVAKPMHVGHLRASIIGEAIKRIFRFRGDAVWGDAHFGDWGFQMGLLIVAVGDEQPSLAFLAGGEGPFPEESPVTLEDLERLYPLAAARAKAEPDYRDRARRATAELQAGRPGYRALWSRFVEVSQAALEREFAALGVTFDLWKGESDADPLISGMVEDLQAKKLLVDDQGARIVRIAREGDKRDLPPLLVVSSEGSAMYGTTDLATILDRRNEIDPDLILYVVDQRQADHFEQVFRAAYLAGYAPRGIAGAHRLRHHERRRRQTVQDPRGRGAEAERPDRDGAGTRRGIACARPTSAPSLRRMRSRRRAHKVAVAALKFADLSNHRSTSYIFDLDRFTSFEGKTGPYLLYQAVRIKSLLRKADEIGAKAGDIVVGEAAERDLALVLDAFDQAVSDAYDRRAPNLIAEHAYRLAQSFSKFYAACPVIAASSAEVRSSRIALSAVTLDQLERALDLLGIETPDRM